MNKYNTVQYMTNWSMLAFREALCDEVICQWPPCLLDLKPCDVGHAERQI
jgi:hypothetical protein